MSVSLPLDSLASDRQVVGIDVGGTKTHLALARDSIIEAEAVVATAGWRTGSTAHDARALVDLLRVQWGDAALHLRIGIGAHGCDTTDQCLAMQRALDGLTSGGSAVVNDAELMTWAMGVRAGIGLVAGTGSIAVARDGDGRLITAGGWGWILGDEGSAAGIVREAVRAVLGELDQGHPDDPLTMALLAGFDVPDGAELAMAMTRQSSAHQWGSHAELVFRAADQGSATAARVLAEAGTALADLVTRLRARGVAATDLVAGGGVIVAQARLRDAFVAAVTGRHPDIAVRVLDTAPVIGAIALAQSLPGPYRPTALQDHTAAPTSARNRPATSLAPPPAEVPVTP